MSARLLISLFLLGIGIGSPWLVRDWLDARSDQNRANRLYDAFVSLPEGMKNRLNKPEKAARSASLVEQEIAYREPSLLASQTKRIMEGFLPPALNAGTGEKIPFFDTISVTSTPRSREIIKNAGSRLRTDLVGQGLKAGDPVFLRIFKEEAELELWMKRQNDPQYTLFKIFRLTACAGRPGPKTREGDGQAPEGFYFGTSQSLRPATRHHLGLDIGYPNAFDAQHNYTGSDLMIHGGVSSAGAFALAPKDMEDVYALTEASIEAGQKIVRINVFPFRMTDGRMDKIWNKPPQWVDFWVNLKEGYDFFENVGVPPDAVAESGRYVFRID